MPCGSGAHLRVVSLAAQAKQLYFRVAGLVIWQLPEPRFGISLAARLPCIAVRSTPIKPGRCHLHDVTAMLILDRIGIREHA